MQSKTPVGIGALMGLLFFSFQAYPLSAAPEIPSPTDKPPASTRLSDLIREAHDKNPGLRAKKQAYESARAKVVKSWLPDDPMVGVDVEGQSDPFKTGSRMNYEYMVSQTIPFPTKLFLNGAVASKEADMAYQMFKEEERTVTWKIEQPSYRLFLSKRTLAALEENKELLNQLSNVVKSRYESGAVSQSDYLKVQIELAQVSIDVFDWRQKEHIAEATVSRYLNKPPDTSYAIEEKPVRTPLAFSRVDLEKAALEKRPELNALKIGVDRAKDARVLAHTEWLPDITGRIEARKFKGEDTIREVDNFIGVSFPVWSLLKGIGGGWRSADEDLRAAESLYEDMKNEVLHKVHEAYSEFLLAENALNTYENIILPQAKQQVDVSLSAYEAGKTDILNLIDAQRTLKSVQISYAKAMSDYEMALSDLRLAVGDDLTG
ncbi:MAG: TolC family protein [Candidatus Omnitrophica bacterium]|nr:TolC family protein [Candidatus Omnitrophota bacterium]